MSWKCWKQLQDMEHLGFLHHVHQYYCLGQTHTNVIHRRPKTETREIFQFFFMTTGPFCRPFAAWLTN